MTILFVCESPGKIKKISTYLGTGYNVKASVGHFRDLDPHAMSIDFANNFKPIYVVTKPDVVRNLRSAMSKADILYIASDLDFEGEAIAQHLYDVLKPKSYKRLIFNSITKDAIMNAIRNAGTINQNLVSAQKARRIVDRIFGYTISPVIQKKIGGKLSAGRVQSVATRIVIDKENEINEFINKNSDSSYFKVSGLFGSEVEMRAILHTTLNSKSSIYKGTMAKVSIATGNEPFTLIKKLLKRCVRSTFTIHSQSEKLLTLNAPPPFETSTLQQEANKRFGMSVDTCMKTAQKLYEGGYITYMRTDSVAISDEGMNAIKKVIIKLYGNEYYLRTVHQNKSANAQEAHEAIRPTNPELVSLEGEVDNNLQIKLYKMIWLRAIASQMAPAKVNETTTQIDISFYLKATNPNPYYYFESKHEDLVFAGFKIVYNDGTTNSTTKPIVKVGDTILMLTITAEQLYLQPPPRYSEATLVRTLKALGIGRPSTYVNTIKTIMDRDYVQVGNIEGILKDTITFKIKSVNGIHVMKIFNTKSTTLVGKANNKIIPTSLGLTVNSFLMEHFSEMLDLKFTAKLEAKLDLIATGKKSWNSVVNSYYEKLMPIISKLQSITTVTPNSNDRLLGVDNNSEIFASRAKYGPVVKKKVGDKFVYSKIIKPLTFDNIKLDDAIKLFAYPKILGKYNAKDITLARGKFGFYLNYDNKNYSKGATIDDTTTLESAIGVIKKSSQNQIGEFDIKYAGSKAKATALNGKFGPYISIKTTKSKSKINIPIPANVDVKKITTDDVQQIIKARTAKK